MQKCFRTVLIILIPLIVYLAAFGFFVYNDRFYTKLTDANSNMPEKAETINSQMVAYFISCSDYPQGLDDFSQKEISHLQDVKKVINGLVSLLMALVLAFVLLISFAQDKARIFYLGGIIALLVPLLLVAIPFDFLFTHMHTVFFEQGTWTFANDSLLINIYPLDFFKAFAKTVFMTGFCLGLVITILARVSSIK